MSSRQVLLDAGGSPPDTRESVNACENQIKMLRPALPPHLHSPPAARFPEARGATPLGWTLRWDSASAMAFAIKPPTGVSPPSPAPLAPNGLFGQGFIQP